MSKGIVLAGNYTYVKLPKRLSTRWHYLNKGLAGLLLVLFIATLSAVVYLCYTLLNLNSLITTSTQVVSNQFVLQDLVSNLQSAESSQRGYIITGNETYLHPYTNAQQAIETDRKVLDKQTFYEGASSYTELTQLMSQKLTEMQMTIDTFNSQGQQAALSIITTNQGLQLMDRIHALANDLETQGNHVVIPRENQAHANLFRALVVASLLVVFVLAICVSILVYFTKALFKERALEGAKSEFLSLASHQLRTPATNVKQYLGLLTEGFLGKLTKQQKEALEVANRNNNAEIDIINGILNITKLDLNRIQLTKKPTDLVAMVQQVADEQRVSALAKKQTITIKTKLEKMIIPIDELYIKNALENLIDNASKYSPVASKIRISIVKRSSTAVLSVEDEGIGIAKKDIARLFKKFSRLEAAADYAQGSGLGLYWVKQIIVMHGGTITAMPGKKQTASKSNGTAAKSSGAIFTISLPLSN
jgi:signal transduction histidine kinase